MNSHPETLVDFHTHSHFSDGVLAPAQLVARAQQRGVSMLALTDHDTTAGLTEARAACEAAGMRFVPGTELSATWRGQTIHLVGLGIDERHAGLQSHMANVLARRHAGLREMARLEKRARLPGRELASIAAGCAAPTRLHLARLLVERGFARDTQAAFDRWLNRNTPGHVPAEWPALDEAMAVLRDSGAVAVLAHPHRYRASSGQLRELTAAFAQAGGAALEASMAGMSPNDADRIAALCRRFKLRASMGSDFHDPAVPWNPLGRWQACARP
jgi:predicted metal-dependent phosphoesterase TrpH